MHLKKYYSFDKGQNEQSQIKVKIKCPQLSKTTCFNN